MKSKTKERITNKKILNIFTLCILIIVPFMKLFSLALEKFGLLSNYDFINPSIVFWFSIPFLIYIYIKDIIDKKRKLDIYDYLFYILVFVGIISIIFSLNKYLAIFGKSYRHEGFLSILSYYLLFINWKINGTKEDIKKYINIILIIGLVNAIYALFQVYTDLPFIVKANDYQYLATAFCGHQNFLGSLMVTVISILGCKFLMEKIDYKKIILMILYFIALINTQSSGPFLAYIITFIFLIIFLIIKKKFILKNLIILLLILISTYFLVHFVNNNIRPLERCELCVETVKQSVQTGGTGRLDIWKNSLEIVSKYPLVGVGFDNFYLAYPNPKLENKVSFSITDSVVEKETPAYYIVDNAHNVYLHTLVSTGILGLIPYLLLCLFTFIRGLKSNDKLVFVLLAGFAAYSIQAFANISVIQVAPIYYIIIGLILSIKQ